MPLPLVCALLLTIALGGCGVSGAGAPRGTDRTAEMATVYATTTAATPTFDQAAFQEQMDHLSSEATIVAATVAAVSFDPSAEPAVATEAARRYQNNAATIAALQPTLSALTTPLAAPHISEAAQAANAASYQSGAAISAANAANMTPLPGQSAEEVAVMQESTIIAATTLALRSGAPVEPAVATEATRRYEANIATITAPQPAPQPTPAPVFPAPTEMPPQPPALLDLQTVPSAPAPGALAGATLPLTRGEVEALFGRLPAAIAGNERVDFVPGQIVSGPLTLRFGEYARENGYQEPRLWLSAQDLAENGGMRPRWTAAHVVVVSGPQMGPVVAQGRDGQLAWAYVTQDAGPYPVGLSKYTLLLGDETSTWLFWLSAPTVEELDALAQAFAEALE